MKRIFCLLSFLFIFFQDGKSQDSFVPLKDTFDHSRLIGTSIGTGVLWAGSMAGLYHVWYKKSTQSPFHSFNDNSNWLQMDKLGHVYSSYKISEVGSDLYRWTGLKPHTSSIIGSCIGLGYQTTLEFFDGFSEDWGFSWGDMASNLAGSSLFLGQELLWSEQRLLPKFSYHPTDYAEIRPEVLGSTQLERLLKDYNGQTYWISFSPGTFVEHSSFPEWLCFSFGYSANAKLKGDAEIYINTETNGTSTSYYAQREYLFSMDLDLSKLPIKKVWLKRIFKQLNHLKIPFPSLIYSNKKLQAHPFYF